MFTNILKNFLKTSAVIAAGTSMLLATTNIALAQPGGGGATCSIDTVPSPPEITAGGTVDFSGNINGGQKTFSWTFEGGVPLNSTAQDVTVTYPNPSVPGTFTATLNGTSTKGACPEVSVEVTVNPAGQCVRNAPTISLGADQFIDPDGSAVYALSVTNNDTTACPLTTFDLAVLTETGDTQSFITPSTLSNATVTVAPGNTNDAETLTVIGNNTGVDGDALTTPVEVSDDIDHAGQQQTDTVITTIQVGIDTPTARGDTYATPIGKTLNVTASRVSGVLYNDFGGTGPLTAVNLDTDTFQTQGSVSLGANGSFNYTPPGGAVDNQVDIFTYEAQDSLGVLSGPTKVTVQILSDQPDYKMTMNYELGMHCTGFEFAYCCVLPPYNSIVAQITKPQTIPDAGGSGPYNQAAAFPRLLDATETVGLDGLGRETVLRDLELDESGEFKKYVVRYFHDAQPRLEGQGKAQGSTLISDIEGQSMFYHASLVDSAEIGPDGQLIYGDYATRSSGPAVAYGVIQGDGSFQTPTNGLGPGGTDNYANAWLNHFYIYADLEGTLNGSCVVPGSTPTVTRCTADADCNTGAGEICSFSLEQDKIRLGVAGQVEYPKNVGASLQPMGPDGNVSGFDNVLTFSTNTGTVVYTQMKVLENLPVMLTSPRIWEALGLPLTPFEDTINFFGNPGLVDEDTVRPYVAMKAQMYHYDGGANDQPVIGSNGEPVIGFGTAPIDIPNCERCHSAPSINTDSGLPNINSPNWQKRAGGPQPWGDPFTTGLDLEGLTDLEYQFWMSIYGILPGQSDWYPRLKSAAINMLAIHDDENGTGFTEGFPACGSLTDPDDQTGCGAPPVTQNNRLGFESVICQKCHADNVIAVVKSGCEVDPTSTVLCPDGGPGTRKIIQPITEAIHWNHRGTDEQDGVIHFSDGLGRDGGCQGCHPAHRSDGVTDGYPITLDGDNFQADSDNRLALGGCFVGRDVHSNPLKDVDGAETPEYLNAVGQWLSDNVYNNQAGLVGSDADTRGVWCTNCHNQLGQSIWAKENMVDLINGIPGKEDDLTTDAVNIRALPSLAAIAAAVGVSENQAKAWLDPTDPDKDPHGTGLGDFTHSIWNPDVVANPDASVAIIEVSAVDTGCGPRFPFLVPRFGVYACLNFDADPGGAVGGAGDPSVRILQGFCTTPDCLTLAQAELDAEGFGSIAAAVPFDAATDGRDHWLAPGEPHCADCHAAPFTEQSGNLNPFPPFNYPRKASLMRYSRGHQDLTCQSCHESIHGLYPVSPTIDTTSYAQAASLNPDGSHGPLKCATCHEVNNSGIPTWMAGVRYNGQRIRTLDDAITWAHTFTDNASVLQPDGVCENCHNDRADKISETSGKWLRHSFYGRVGRKIQDKAEREALFACAVGAPNALQTCADDSDCGDEPGACVGDVAGGKYVDANTPQAIYDTVCTSCHQLNGGPDVGFQNLVACDNTTWKNHLIQGRVAEEVWEFVSVTEDGSTCGW